MYGKQRALVDNHRTQDTATMLANAIRLAAESHITATMATNWSVNLSDSVRQMDLGRPRNFRHASVSSLYFDCLSFSDSRLLFVKSAAN